MPSLLLLLFLFLTTVNSAPTPADQTSVKTWPTCDSPIYCYGDMLKTIQLSSLFKDSKTFVDMPTTKPPKAVLDEFAKLPPNPSVDQLKQFVGANFLEAGIEIKPADLPDFKADPEFLQSIDDLTLRGFAKRVHAFWPNLTRKADFSMLCEGCVSSLIKPNHTFVVPGGRFREFYYWDTFFTLQGMLLGELYDTSKEMLLNFFDFIDKLGFVPNGARIYYHNRSQPPLLAAMVKSYVDYSGDTEILKLALPALDKEYKFWQSNTTVQASSNGKSYTLNRYIVQNSLPRPEGFAPDWHTVEESGLDAKAKEELYADLATGAETGWDYSARWSWNRDNATSLYPLLRALHVRQIVPVDLNSVLYMNERLLSGWHREGGDGKKAAFYDKQAKERRNAMEALLYDEASNTFHDFNLTSGQKSEVWSLAQFWPYWARAYPKKFDSDPNAPATAFAKIQELIKQYPGAMPATLIKTGQQWDFPNAWPPLDYALVRAILNVYQDYGEAIRNRPKLARRQAADGDEAEADEANDTERKADDNKDKNENKGKESGSKDEEIDYKEIVPAPESPENDPAGLYSLAREVGEHYIRSAFCAWYETGGSVPDLLQKLPGETDDGHMFEKFNAEEVGEKGEGGEYEVQAGFGWSNGVAAWTLYQFGKELRVPSCNVTRLQRRMEMNRMRIPIEAF
ncbi:uncharacterized protein VTP21DRAFT_3852 [Calcarisporiella thermophila]|uniref:uncharacterized protein n=1 Tax=Calcarisporiella thermophila TaxID=911321 RepID=UPI00374455B3